jgi:hypothetical protein
VRGLCQEGRVFDKIREAIMEETFFIYLFASIGERDAAYASLNKS